MTLRYEEEYVVCRYKLNEDITCIWDDDLNGRLYFRGIFLYQLLVQDIYVEDMHIYLLSPDVQRVDKIGKYTIHIVEKKVFREPIYRRPHNYYKDMFYVSHENRLYFYGEFLSLKCLCIYEISMLDRKRIRIKALNGTRILKKKPYAYIDIYELPTVICDIIYEYYNNEQWVNEKKYI